MSGFSLDWLDLREPADGAARDRGLLAAAAAYLDATPGAVAVDLGCGSGSTLRAMGAVLARPPAWRLVDHDPRLLEAAARRAGPDLVVETVEADLTAIGKVPLQGARLVTASALLDLASEAWIGDLARGLAEAGAGLYAALTYDGVMTWDQAHPLDAAVTAAFNDHQRTEKGFGPALGPDATAVAVRRLSDLGFTTATAASPWVLGPDQAGLEAELVSGIAAAVLETGRLSAGEVEDWRLARLDLAGRAGGRIGHLDLLALPPA